MVIIPIIIIIRAISPQTYIHPLDAAEDKECHLVMFLRIFNAHLVPGSKAIGFGKAHFLDTTVTLNGKTGRFEVGGLSYIL
jgi:hypothetical protein